MHIAPEEPQALSIESHGQIAEAWERFTSSGDVEPSTIRHVIRQSWLKSRKLGIDHEIERAPTVITAEEIESRLRTEDLTQAGLAALSKLKDLLHDTQHVVALADHNGHILYSIGHDQIRDKLENINFMPGGAWAESIVGPNGVGTPLELGRPELVMGHEHYCQGWKPWVCYGAPIYDLNGKSIKGAIDITGPVEKISKQTMALAISVAQSVQSGLMVIQYRRRDNLREESQQYLSRWANDGIIILDEHSCIVECNSKALRLLNLENFDLNNHSIMSLIPNIGGTVNECFQNMFSAEVEVLSNGKFQNTNRMQIKIKPVIQDGVCIGTCLILADPSVKAAKNLKRSTSTKHLAAKYSFEDIRGNSNQIKQVIKLAHACANDRLQNSVLLIGDTGTGKELVAHSIHSASPRAHAPFIAVNCAAIPAELIESELFGYVNGAFTGARKGGMKGKFEAAHTGTLFLDEINSMNVDLQAKLLRVLDSMEVNRVGASEPMQVDVRVIAAANRNINNEVDSGKFRSDLFHRISVLEIPLPSLSERGKDIIELAEAFIYQECEAAERDILTLSKSVEKVLLEYAWPGNVRELYNVCMRWVITVQGDEVSLKDVPDRLFKQSAISNKAVTQSNNLHELGDEIIKQTLEQTNHNISKAARLLGIDRSTIYRRSRKWVQSS